MSEPEEYCCLYAMQAAHDGGPILHDDTCSHSTEEADDE